MKEDIKNGIYRIEAYVSNVMLYVNGMATPLIEKAAANFGQMFIIGEWKKADPWFINEYGTNITSEFLANTYGTVESKEHAEFIKVLGEAYGFKFTGGYESFPIFAFYESGRFYFHRNRDGKLSTADMKQITIPMPPKEADAVDEWPKLGDEVVIEAGSERYSEIKGYRATVIGICNHSDGAEILTIEHNSLRVFAITNGEWIKKPKTPEEELRDEIEYAIHHSTTVFTYAEHLAKYLLDQYTLTKKQ